MKLEKLPRFFLGGDNRFASRSGLPYHRVMTKASKLAWLALFVLLSASQPLFAQIATTTFEFSFSNPGARSLGLGGAFVALADDATAAFANPAGLVQLARTEISAEGKLWNYQTPFTSGGRLSGLPTGIGLDDNQGLLLRTSEYSATLSDLSYLSFVYPKGDWSFAVYRHQLAKFESAVETQGFFASTSEGETYRIPDIRGSNSFEVVTYGLSGAYRINENLSIGIGLSYFVGNTRVTTEFYEPVPSTLPEGLFGPTVFAPQAISTSSEAVIDDTSWGASLGFLWRINEQWSVGGVYRGAPTMAFAYLDRSGPQLEPTIPAGTILDQDDGLDVDFPAVLGAGIAYRSKGGTTTVSFEWDRVFYSSIMESIERETPDDQNAVMDDASELRLGVEYVFLKLRPVLALRGGIWLDPDHRIRSVARDDAIARAFFRAGDDELHGALGVGIVFERFQIDFGIDLSELVKSASLSAIFSF
jgi:long-subunit fatty acid transport protein